MNLSQLMSPAAGDVRLSCPQLSATQFSAARLAATAAATGGEGRADDVLEQTRERLQQFIGETFYGVLMQQFEKGLNQHNPLHGGRGEQVFRGEMNQLMVRQLAARGGFALADSAAEMLLKNTPHSKVVSEQRVGLSLEA